MNQRRLLIAAAIIGGAIIIGFVLSVPHTRDLPRPVEPEKVTPAIPTVSLHDGYKKGVHTITGNVTAPNACTQVAAHASLASSTQSIVVAATFAADSGVCLQVPTRITFSTTLAAPGGLPLSATVNGVSATITP